MTGGATSLLAPAGAREAPVLSVRGLGKAYPLYASPRQRFRTLLTGRRQEGAHWALRGVNFDLLRGQCLGVVGDNGAGKSTLLKLMTGTIAPTEGTLTRQGRLTAILELGAGFHPDFTGRENLYFAGSLIDIPAPLMDELLPGILEFSGLAEAIDRPVKTYSSGMAVRLAFALVTAIEPQVLIVDEALAVGDQQFQKKCVERIEAFRRNGCTILFCSHSLYHVRHLCDVALWLDRGQVQAAGDTAAVLAAYEGELLRREAAAQAPALPLNGEPDGAGAPAGPDAVDAVGAAEAAVAPLNGSAAIESVRVDGLSGEAVPRLMRSDLTIHIAARTPSGEDVHVGVMIEQAHGVGITSVGTQVDHVKPLRDAEGLACFTLTFPDLPLHTGDYVLSVYLFDSSGLVIYDEWRDCVRLHWVHPSPAPGLVHLPHVWNAGA